MLTGPAIAADRKEAARYWVRDDLGGLELLWGRFRQHAYRPHSHPGYVIAVVTEGVEAVNCRGALHRSGPGDILFVNPEAIHDGQRGGDEGWQYRVFYPTIATVQVLISGEGSARSTPYFHETVVHDPVLARRLAELHADLEDSRFSFGAQATWTELLGELLDRYASCELPRKVNRPEPLRVRRARELIETHFDQPLTLDRLAAEVQLSAFHLIRSFRAEMGVSPHAYLIACRLRRAKALLDLGEGSARAAAAAGFVDQSHFIRHFKAAYGFTPGQYVAARSPHP